jgi:Rrf2 family protein
MRISRKAEYAIHTILYLILHNERAVPLATLAEHQGVSSDYLAKVMQTMSGKGIVNAVTGPGGGYRLSKAPDAITFTDVVKLFDRPESVYSCLHLERECDRYPHCGLMHVLDEAVEAFYQSLEKTTFLDLLKRADRTKTAPKWLGPEALTLSHLEK